MLSLGLFRIGGKTKVECPKLRLKTPSRAHSASASARFKKPRLTLKVEKTTQSNQDGEKTSVKKISRRQPRQLKKRVVSQSKNFFFKKG